MEQNGPEISVIIPAYNAVGTLRACLEALGQQTLTRDLYEVLVVDDGSTDGTAEAAKSQAGVRVLVQPNTGPAAARNLGAIRARGEILLFTDADCAPAPDWIEQMRRSFERDPNVAGVKGAYSSAQPELVARFVQREYEEKYERMLGQATAQNGIDFIDTYSAGYRRDVFLQNGGFDTSFPTACVEDQELSFRLAGRGYRLVFAPQARVRHLGHARSIESYWRKKYKIGYWKAGLHSRYPGKMLSDSHTPQGLKLQMLLALGCLITLIAGIAWRPAFAVCASTGLLLLVTTLPFAQRAGRLDPQVALAAPILLCIRALALGLGFATGAIALVIPSALSIQRRFKKNRLKRASS